MGEILEEPQTENRFTEKVIELKKQANEDEKFKPYRESALMWLAQKDRNQACECLVDAFKENHRVYAPINDEAPEIWVYENGIYIPNGKTVILEFCRKILGDAYTTSIGNQVSERIRLDSLIDPKVFFDKEIKDEIVMENGILNLKTKKLSEFTPEKIFFNKIPVKYDPEATCPKLIEHLNLVLENAEHDVPVIQELIGYMLHKDYPYEKAFMFIGTGRNGKSVTMEVIKRFLGVENCVSVSLHQMEEDQYALAELHHKLVNMSLEVNAKALTSTSKFKSLTGKDLLSANRKYLSHLYFTNYAKQVFACNELPQTYDDSIAFYARWVILNFPYNFYLEEEYKTKQQDPKAKLANPEIIDKLTTSEELSGLLNWALGGLDRLFQQKGFSHSQTTDEIRNAWLRKSDSFKAFCLDNLEEDYDSVTTKEDLAKAYIKYCKDRRARILSSKHIHFVLTEMFGAFEHRITLSEGGSQERVWKGVRLREKCNQEVINSQPIQANILFGTLGEKKILGIEGKTHVSLDRMDLLIKTIPKMAYFLLPYLNENEVFDILPSDLEQPEKLPEVVTGTDSIIDTVDGVSKADFT